VAHIGKSDRDAGTMRMLNNQLEKINKNITGKLFHLKQDLAAEERKKISKEIHDAAGYIFVNLISMLQTASVLFHRNPDKAESLINDAREYSSRGINEIRHILYQVRDYSPSLQSLQNELYSIGKSFANATGVAVSVEFGNWPVSFSPRLDMFFISFMQEALTNALKHGLATVIDVRCSIISNVIELAVSDNGRGATEPIRRGIGITSMEEFVGALGGFIRIGSDAVGFTIAASVPASAVDGDAERE
jgi:signal transduction histidine kinase